LFCGKRNKKHIGHGTFKGISKELNDVIEKQKVFFEAELEKLKKS